MLLRCEKFTDFLRIFVAKCNTRAGVVNSRALSTLTDLLTYA